VARGERRFIERPGRAVQPSPDFPALQTGTRHLRKIHPDSRTSGTTELSQNGYFGSSMSSSSSVSRAGMA